MLTKRIHTAILFIEVKACIDLNKYDSILPSTYIVLFDKIKFDLQKSENRLTCKLSFMYISDAVVILQIYKYSLKK